MKFTVSQSSLAQALLIVSKGMATNSTLAYLSGIYIKAAEGTLEFQTANLTISIKHCIPADVEEEGVTVVSGKVLTSIVKILPDQAVTFEMVPSTHTLEIRCHKSQYRLNTLDASDFPEFPAYEMERSIELPSRLLSDMVDKVYKVATPLVPSCRACCCRSSRTRFVWWPPTPIAWPSATPTRRLPLPTRPSSPSCRARPSMMCSPCRP